MRLTTAQREHLDKIHKRMIPLQYARMAVPCTPREQPRWDDLNAQVEKLQAEADAYIASIKATQDPTQTETEAA